MGKAIREHIRSNVVGYIAIFMFAMGGTAYATHPGGADTISTIDIQNGEVKTADIGNGEVRSADVANHDTPNALTGIDIAADSLTSADLAPDSVGSSEVATDAIGTSEVATESLGSADLGLSSVGSSELATNAISSVGCCFGDGSTELAPGSVAETELEPDSVTSSELGSNSVREDEIRLNAVGASEVADGSLGTAEFASSIPAARVTRTVLQNIPRNSTTTLSFNSERYDTANMHSNTTNPTRLTAPVSGIYAVTAQVRWDATGSGYRCLDLRRTGAEVVAAQCWDAPIIVDPDMNVTTMLSLAAGDFVEARALQSCCDTLPILKGNAYSPEFSMTWLAPGP